MPASPEFQQRLEDLLPRLTKKFPTPFYLYDYQGIATGMAELREAFGACPDYRNYFAVKANPNLHLLSFLHGLGCGFDCSSPLELKMARMANAEPDEIMFSSNATQPSWFKLAADDGGCIINFDDPELMELACQVIPFPELFCCRYNPGKLRTSGFSDTIGKPDKAKFGVPHGAYLSTYKRAKNLGASRFAMHTMICSNERNWRNLAQTVNMELEITGLLKEELNIELEWINSGGGFGIPYKPGEKPLNYKKLADRVIRLCRNFKAKYGFAPRLVTENGRWITGPHGVLVLQVVSHKHGHQYGHRECVCVNASTVSAMPRSAMYSAYHHISVVGADDRPKKRVYIVGPLCENLDFFTCNGKEPAPRLLPEMQIGDIAYIHECGAHVRAMTSNYNSGLRPAELALLEDGSIELIRSAETDEKLLAEFHNLPKIIKL